MRLHASHISHPKPGFIRLPADRLLYAILLAACLLTTFSCNDAAGDTKNIFCYNESSGIPGLDPAFAKNQAVMWPVHQLFNTLIEVDDHLRPVPSLARSFDMSEDGMAITFHLRTDVFFHDDPCFAGGRGRKMKASDVAFSFTRILDKSTSSPGNWIFNGRVDSLIPFSAPDDSTFILRLRRPFRAILGILTMPYCSVMAPEALARYGADLRSHPVGTGPFRLVKWEEGQALILGRNPRYFETDSAGNRLPYLSGVKVSFFDSKASEFLEFRQGRLDMINDVDPSFKDEILTRKGSLRKNREGKVILMKSPYLNVEYLGMLTDSSVAGDPRFLNRYFRQAVNHAIDRRKLVFFLRNSIGIPAEHGFIPPVLLQKNPDHAGYSYDPEKVRQLLRLAGYDYEKEEPVILQTVPAYTNLGTFIVSQLNAVGIKAVLEVMQKSLLLDQMSAGRISFFRASWIADYPDAENYCSVFYGKNPAPPNYTRFRNGYYDLLYEQAVAGIDDDLRTSLYLKMDSIITAEAPVVPLWYDEVLNLVQPGIAGYRPNQRNMLELRRVVKMKNEK